MHAIFTSLIALSAVALAAPVNYEVRSLPLYTRSLNSTLATTNGTTITNGTTVCGMAIPSSLESCTPTAQHFTLGSNGLNATNSTTPPANTECDHSTAIHVLNDALTSNGACTALDGILTAGNLTDSKSMLIQPLFKAIGDTGNNVYLNKTVNGDKKTLMQQAFGTGDSGAISGVAVSDVNKFFGDEQVKNAAQRLGPKLDRLTGHMITHAAQLANAAINNTMQGTAKSTALAAVNASKGDYKPDSGSVKNSWAKLQSYAGRQS